MGTAPRPRPESRSQAAAARTAVDTHPPWCLQRSMARAVQFSLWVFFTPTRVQFEHERPDIAAASENPVHRASCPQAAAAGCPRCLLPTPSKKRLPLAIFCLKLCIIDNGKSTRLGLKSLRGKRTLSMAVINWEISGSPGSFPGEAQSAPGWFERNDPGIRSPHNRSPF